MPQKGKSKKTKQNKAKRKGKRKQIKTKRNQKEQKSPLTFGIILGIIGIIIAVPSLIIFFSPRISVYIDTTLYPYHPFDNSIIVKNNGQLTLKNIKYTLIIDKTEDNWRNVNFSSDSHDSIPLLKPNKSSPLYLRKDIFAPSGFITSAIIRIDMSYQSSYIPFKTFSDIYRFKLIKDTYGKLHWQESYSQLN